MPKHLIRIVIGLTWVALFAGVLGSVAKAETPFGAEEAGYYRIATEYWGGGTTECTVVHRSVVPTLPDGLWGLSGHCWLQVSKVPLDLDPRLACLVVVHEVGHLRGLEHSNDPQDVMYPSISWGELARVPGCQDPEAAIAQLPPEALPTWPDELVGVEDAASAWRLFVAKCESRKRRAKARCRKVARRWHVRLVAQRAQLEAVAMREPIFD